MGIANEKFGPQRFSFYLLIGIILFFLSGCVISHHSPIEVKLAERLQEINLRLGTTRNDLSNEISNSAGYSREQAVDLKRRIGELVVAYEELAIEANCAERHYPPLPGSIYRRASVQDQYSGYGISGPASPSAHRGRVSIAWISC